MCPKSWKCSDESAEINEARKAEQRADEVIQKVKSQDAEVDQLVSHLAAIFRKPQFDGLLTLSNAIHSL